MLGSNNPPSGADVDTALVIDTYPCIGLQINVTTEDRPLRFRSGNVGLTHKYFLMKHQSKVEPEKKDPLCCFFFLTGLRLVLPLGQWLPASHGQKE